MFGALGVVEASRVDRLGKPANRSVRGTRARVGIQDSGFALRPAQDPFRSVQALTRVRGIAEVRLQDIVRQGLACVGSQ